VLLPFAANDLKSLQVVTDGALPATVDGGLSVVVGESGAHLVVVVSTAAASGVGDVAVEQQTGCCGGIRVLLQAGVAVARADDADDVVSFGCEGAACAGCVVVVVALDDAVVVALDDAVVPPIAFALSFAFAFVGGGAARWRSDSG